jgi:glycine/D-amino acid oxidase-like deaminating enzyme
MGLVHPVKLVQGLMAAAQRHGAQTVATTVLQIHPDGESVRLQTTQGTIRAGGAIVAANAWLPDILPQLRQVITPVRGQVLTYQPLPPLFTTGVTANLAGLGEYWQQTPDGTLLLGGCRTAAEGHDVGIRVSQPTAPVQMALEQVFPQLFPQLPELHVAQRWAGLMAFTPDLLPVVTPVSGLVNTWAVGGFSGHGMPYGLRFGQLLAQAVSTMSLPADLRPFQLDRATLRSPQT